MKDKAMILGVQDMYYFVADMARAVRFYRDTLRLAVTRQNSFEVGGVRFGFHWIGGAPAPTVPQGPEEAQAGGTVRFRASDLPTLVSRLRAAGVKTIGNVVTADWGSVVSFEDPEGNVLKLMEPPST